MSMPPSSRCLIASRVASPPPPPFRPGPASTPALACWSRRARRASAGYRQWMFRTSWGEPDVRHAGGAEGLVAFGIRAPRLHLCQRAERNHINLFKRALLHLGERSLATFWCRQHIHVAEVGNQFLIDLIQLWHVD